MAKNRSSNEITTDILRACASGGISATRILYKANLAWHQGKAYIANLVADGLLESFDDCSYVTSQKGFAWLELEERQAQLLKSEIVLLAS